MAQRCRTGLLQIFPRKLSVRNCSDESSLNVRKKFLAPNSLFARCGGAGRRCSQVLGGARGTSGVPRVGSHAAASFFARTARPPCACPAPAMPFPMHPSHVPGRGSFRGEGAAKRHLLQVSPLNCPTSPGGAAPAHFLRGCPKWLPHEGPTLREAPNGSLMRVRH